MTAGFTPQEILAALDRHAVRYVLIGGLAAILHGAPHVTTDVDIVPEEALRNLERLSAVLRELNARIRVAGEDRGVPFRHDAESLVRVRIWNLVTDLGNLDITFVPSGTQGYEDLRRDAVSMRVRGVDVPVASLADVIRSKEAAGRERDRAVLPTLRRMLDRGGQWKEGEAPEL
jgi:predicted nucleotidyltransferase